ncbi:hypothetical protein [Paenibacillus abyssi]|uniref:Uncharacterized protein n=1 Tax=Paenibacillus abyssi TaxID=1340531 RepID=A0A917CGX3_9BACL|nr:hypothetical protein [Paenibacillus abyssi]GGF88160.1 hypothetical protein GCM10010916_01800 [Paenibacillus abyssi]
MDDRNERKISVGINVKSAASLPRLGAQLQAFFSAIEEYVGPADINLAVSVNPTPAAAIGPIEYPQEPPRDIEIIFVPDEGERD